MRRTRLALCIPLAVAAACGEDVDPTAGCPTRDDAARATATISGSVVDFATGAPIAGATVDLNTSWDAPRKFPAGCPPITTFTTRADGTFGPETVEIGSSLDPPIIIFLVTAPDRAPTASDLRVADCIDGQCGDVSHSIAVPTAAQAAAWRAELAAGGMPRADERGLILFEFREPDGAPAAGVTPLGRRLVQGTDSELLPLTPAVEFRVLDSDCATLAPPTQSATAGSGVAVIGYDHHRDPDDVTRDVAGLRGDNEIWFQVGCFASDGWLFLEDRRAAVAP